MNSRGEKSPRALQSRNYSCRVTKQQFKDFISIREIEGICKKWLQDINRYLKDYLNYVNWIIDKEKTIYYLKLDMKRFSISTFRKKTYQIKKFLNYCGYYWINEIKLPKEPENIVKRITKDDIKKSIEILSNHSERNRYITLLLLGSSSGLRAEELYQLNLKDIDIENRIVYVNHNPNNKQTTKTKKSRISFFTIETQQVLRQFLNIYKKSNRYSNLFTKSQCITSFKSTPIKVKDLRKFFSQIWDRNGGVTTIKKILMGHSLRNDVDLLYYNYQSPEDLKKIYDKVMGNLILLDEVDNK